MVQISLLMDLPWSCCPKGRSLELADVLSHELIIHPPAGGVQGDPCEVPCIGNTWYCSARAPQKAEDSMRGRAMGHFGQRETELGQGF